MRPTLSCLNKCEPFSSVAMGCVCEAQVRGLADNQSIHRPFPPTRQSVLSSHMYVWIPTAVTAAVAVNLDPEIYKSIPLRSFGSSMLSSSLLAERKTKY